MGTTVYLQRFHAGNEAAVPFEAVIEFLENYGTPGVGPYRNEITFRPDEFADDARVIGNEAEGAICVAFHRPIVDDNFRRLVFSAMKKFGFSTYEDAFDTIYVPPGSTADVPVALLEEFTYGVQEVRVADALWAADA